MTADYDDDRLPDEDSAGRVILRWVFGIAGAIALAVLLGLYSFVQVTEQAPAETLLARAMVPLSQIDELLASPYYEELQGQADAAFEANETLIPARLPVAIELEPEEVLDTSVEELRTIILQRSAARLYEEGIDAFLVEGGTRADVDRFSPGGTVDMGFGNLTRDAHENAEGYLQIVAIAAVVSLGLFVLLGRGFGRITLLGVAILLASLISIGGLFAIRALLRTLTSADGDPFIEGLNNVMSDGVALPIQNFITFAGLGLGIVLLGAIVTLVSRRFDYGAE